MSVDYEKLRALNERRKENGAWSLRLINEAHMIVAMKILGFRYTEIVDFLFEEFPEYKNVAEKNQLNNNKLLKVVQSWQKKNLLSESRIKDEIKKIEGIAGPEKEEEFI